MSPNSPPNYASSSSTKPNPTTAPPGSNPNNGIKFQLNIEKLSLDASIPLGSNLGVQVSVPPGPVQSSNTPSASEPSSSSSSHIPNSRPTTSHQNQNQPQSQNQQQPQSTLGFSPENILLNLATSFISRLENLERNLEDEKRLNEGYRDKIDNLQIRLNELESGSGNSTEKTEIDNNKSSLDQSSSKDRQLSTKIPQIPTYNINPPSQTNIPTSLSQRQNPSYFNVNQEIVPDQIDNDEIWGNRSSSKGIPTSKENQGGNEKGENNDRDRKEETTQEKEEEGEEEYDDPSGLGLDDDQAILYGFKPRR